MPSIAGTRAFFHAYDRRLWVLFGGAMVSSMGFAMVLPFLSLYFHEELGVSMSIVGAFFLVTAALRSVSQTIAGELSDRIGRLGLMVGGQAARGVLFLIMAWAVAAGLGFWVASGIVALSYVAGALYQPVADAAVSDLVAAERRLDAYAMMRIAHNLGWGVGPMLGGFVSEAGYAWLFVLGALASGFSAWLLRRYLGETFPGARARSERGSGSRDGPGDEARGEPRSGPRSENPLASFLEIRRDHRFLVFCGWSQILFLAMAQWLSTLSVDASGRLGVSRAQLGLLFGMNGFMVVGLQLPVVRAMKGLSLSGGLALGSLVYSVSFFAVAFAQSYPQLLLCMAAITLGELIATPPGTALVSLIAPKENLGRYMGWYGLTTAFGWSVGPFVGGILLDWWSGEPVLLWGAVASLAALAAWGFWRSRGLYPAGPGIAASPGHQS